MGAPSKTSSQGGRPPREVDRAYLRAVMTTCTLERWGQIAARAVSDAACGDPQARDWLSKYLLPSVPVLERDWVRDSEATAGALQLDYSRLTNEQVEQLTALLKLCEPAPPPSPETADQG